MNAYEVEMQAFRKVMAAHRRDDLKSHLQANCLYTGISSGPNSMGVLSALYNCTGTYLGPTYLLKWVNFSVICSYRICYCC